MTNKTSYEQIKDDQNKGHNFINNLFGICKRLYYFITAIFTVSALETFYSKMQYSKQVFDNPTVTTIFWKSQAALEAPRYLALAFLCFPIAFIIHKIFHWIIWGTLSNTKQ